MTAFNKNDLPNSITTVEALAAWANSILNYLYFDTVVTENVGSSTRVAQAAPFEVTASNPIEWRYIQRISTPLNKAWLAEGKLWEHIEPLGSGNIPNGFKQ